MSLTAEVAENCNGKIMVGMQRRRSRPTAVASPADAANIVNVTSTTARRSSSPTDDQQQQQQAPPMASFSSDSEQQLEGILFVVGDALLDVYADVSREFIESNHLQFGKAIVATEMHQGHNPHT